MRTRKEIFGFGKNDSFNIKDVLKQLPNLLQIGNKKVDMEWKPDKEGKPTIISNISIPLLNKMNAVLQSLTVLSVDIAKKLFSLTQRIIIRLDHKEKFKQDFPLFKNESFKDLKDLIVKIKDSLTSSASGKIKSILSKLGLMKESYNIEYIKEAEKERTDVIVKVGNKWRIKGRKVKYWDAEYDTKADAEAALRAYWANKRERFNNTGSLVLEGFKSDVGKSFIRNIVTFLSKIFGSSLYFDHITDNKADLYYKGEGVAELFYDDRNEEVVIIPNNDSIDPVSFYDTSEYEIKDYLSDLILGDLDPEVVY